MNFEQLRAVMPISIGNTKLITAVAAMILVEECKPRLEESIEPWLAELANRRVPESSVLSVPAVTQ